MKKSISVLVMIMLFATVSPSVHLAAEENVKAPEVTAIRVLSINSLAAANRQFVTIEVNFKGTPPTTYYYTKNGKSGTLNRIAVIGGKTGVYSGYIN